MTVRYANHVNKRRTLQTEPTPGDKNEVKNNAGGYVYKVDKWQRLLRFLILGSDGGTYYVGERELTRENALVVAACLEDDAARTIQTIVEVSDAGRAPKNDPAILALAIAASVKAGDTKELNAVQIRQMALGVLPRVCRIPTHLFHFMEYVKGQRGFGRGMRRAMQDWYGRWTPNEMAYQAVKYQARDGWSHRDVLRQAHLKLSADHQSVLRWIVGAPVESERIVSRKSQHHAKGEGVLYGPASKLPAIIEAFELAKKADTKQLVALIREHKMTREMLPTEALNEVAVWEALLETMPLTAMLRNLGKMTSIGLLKGTSAHTQTVASRLTDEKALRKSRVHPMAILNALRVYRAGHGDKGKLTWTTVARIADALDAAFYASFGNVEPTGKNIMLALDVSGSMGSTIAGTGLTCREASAAMALITANVEKNHHFVGFCNGSGRSSWGHLGSGITELSISPRQRLDDVVATISHLPFGGTDCALPMIHARKGKLDIDSFVVYTDNETWAGTIKPTQALAEYRQKCDKPQASSVVVGMTATDFTIADPADPRMLDVVGFDTATPQVISTFIGQ